MIPGPLYILTTAMFPALYLWLGSLVIGILAALAVALLSFAFLRFRQRKNRELLDAKDQQTRQLQELNQIKSTFLANISHELRTPLSLILGPAEKLLEKTDDENDRIQLLWIKQNGQKLLNLINQLLDLSKIEAGQYSLKFTQQDIGQFCIHVASAFESLAAHRGLRLIVHAEPEQHYVYFDPERFEHVINNLLHNAIKFTEEGTVTLEVGSAKVTDGEAVEISVTDTGIGIHRDKQPHIFDRFYQASEHAGIEYEGTGIGLALCKDLVEMHGGSISVISAAGKGATFIVRLPTGRDHIDDADILPVSTYVPGRESVFAPVETPAIIPAKDIPNRHQILIVDDNADLRDFLIIQLQEKYNVISAADGHEALELAFEHTPEIIISDVMMPMMNGFELCEKLKNDIRTDHIPVILLTARVGIEHKIEGFEARADDYIRKPFSSDELIARIANLIESRRLLRKKYAEHVVFNPADIAGSSRELEFITSLNDLIEKELANTELDVEMLCRSVGLSRSQLNRKMKAVLGKSPNAYIRSYRLEKARQLLASTDANVAEIAYDVGFSSPAYFTKCFRDEFGHPPTELPEQNITN